MTAILQITDTHIVPEGALVSGRLDTFAALTRLIERITSIQHQIDAIDAILISGDLSDNGSPESYDRIKSLLEPLGLPLLMIPGNHDARAPMRATFCDQFAADGPLDWVQKIGDLTVIGLDTLVEGAREGTLAPSSLAFLKTQLKNAKDAPVLLAMHHPPFQTGVKFLDDIGLTNRDAFCELLADHAGPLRIICGHIHSMTVADVGGHVAISAPSPCSTFAYDRRADAPVGFMSLEDGCLLHKWEAGFHSIRIGPNAGPGPFPF